MSSLTELEPDLNFQSWSRGKRVTLIVSYLMHYAAYTLFRSLLHVPFLNLMSNIQSRAGRVNIRVGGNTQDTAAMVDSLPNNTVIMKETQNTESPVSLLLIVSTRFLIAEKTKTPALLFTPEAIYVMANISALLNIRWYLGVFQ